MESDGDRSAPRVVLCSVNDAMTQAWQDIAANRPGVEVYQGSILEVGTDAVVSPANSFGLMRGGIDAVYSHAWPTIEQRVRSAVLAFHGGELPVGEASCRGDRRGETWLAVQRTHDARPPPRLSRTARCIRIWPHARSSACGALVDSRTAGRCGGPSGSIALPGLGTGVGGVSAESCARQVAAAWGRTVRRSRPVGHCLTCFGVAGKPATPSALFAWCYLASVLSSAGAVLRIWILAGSTAGRTTSRTRTLSRPFS